ncbi:MAG: 8-oxoguanine DNA glycosylase [bacterium (Candidatus Stahlbacteria) CG08_land_8_20_14_0_20_40_26]|nr:MAG: 8-oxoguanine DNA glycosylase [bacterium (Candidatus Stahlbacteria) CG23_combo_of_CG06-09_8_20_14_all_40_9]PIS23933.1 MAG: 8-oxoguanine DNA glycosylase [bacterium (Candidatus Stahlbacteria) CG08_land_8_20_14_0_20_40_26]
MQQKCYKTGMEINNLSLYYTLECGQTFRWRRTSDCSYFGIVEENAFIIRQHGNIFEITSTESDVEEWARRYFALDIDLNNILLEIDRDEHIHKAIKSCRGLHILRQEAWETLASYILSANNNIPNIKRMVENLSQRLGERREIEGYSGFTFPSPSAILKNKDIVNKCRLGFRCDYLIKAAEMIREERIELVKISRLSYEECREELMKIMGVGGKIADCVALFSFGMYEAFPVDVWIRRIIRNLYFSNNKVSNREIRHFAMRYFGRYCGYAQEYLYCHYRLNKPEGITSQTVEQAQGI